MRKPLLVAGLAASLLASPRARAGVTITFQHGAGPATMYVDGDRMRIDTPERNERATAIVFDGPSKRFLMIDDRNKTYTEITQEDRKRMRAQMEAMRAQMQERLKNMSPEQRKQMESMMGPGGGAMMMGDGKPHEWKFESTGQKKTINGFACDMYRVTEDGELREQDCISPWSAGVVKKSDFAGVAKLAQEMFEGMGGMGGERARSGGMFARIEKAPGIPISRVPIGLDGKPGEEEQLKSVKRGTVAAALFAVPAGFAKKELPEVGRGMGPGGHRHGPPPQ